MAITLVVNPGSVTKKYALYNDRQAVMHFRFAHDMQAYEVCTHSGDGLMQCDTITHEEFQNAFSYVATKVKQYLEKEQQELSTICIRVVAPGKRFQSHQDVDEAFIIALREKELSAPLHVPYVLQEIQNIRQTFAGISLVAISDSAFHSTLPEKAHSFSIDRSDAETYDIYRYGFHGLSVASVIKRIHPMTGLNPDRVVVCHVGAGVSVTAVKNGLSVETTMGYSASSGLPMGSRAGDIDPGGLLQLMRAKNLKPSEIEIYLHTKGGLQGLSETADIRRLLDRRSKGDAIATQTLDLFVYHIQKAIASSTVALGGIDMLVLTGTACTRSSELRALIAGGIAHFGVEIDPDKNEVLVGQYGVCSTQDSPTKVITIRTDEMGEMVQAAELRNLPV